MLATLVDDPFDDKRWIFETKWDGFRLITEKRGHAIRLWSRNGIDVTARYATLLPPIQKIDASSAFLVEGPLVGTRRGSIVPVKGHYLNASKY
jgi:bifunctional non-homologous end joining protein LigD